MRYDELLRRLHTVAADAQWETYGRVTKRGAEFPLVCLTVPGAGKWLYLIAGFHGEESSGPRCVAHCWPWLVQHARRYGVGVKVYPCVNPIGFDRGRRFSRQRHTFNNSFIEYLVAGQWQHECGAHETATQIRWAQPVPRETGLLRQHLVRQPRPTAFLDLHQDIDIQGSGASYAYVYGDRARYQPLMHAATRHARAYVGPIKGDRPRVSLHTDRDGLVTCHDGSGHDYFNLVGVPLSATVETDTALPRATVYRINRVWIHGFLRRVAHG
jgi:predicted deacylase